MLTGFGIRRSILRIVSNFSYDLEVRLIGSVVHGTCPAKIFMSGTCPGHVRDIKILAGHVPCTTLPISLTSKSYEKLLTILSILRLIPKPVNILDHIISFNMQRTPPRSRASRLTTFTTRDTYLSFPM